MVFFLILMGVWYMNGATTLSSGAVIYHQGVSLDWQLVGTGDFNPAPVD